MKRLSALTTVALMSSVMVLTAVPGIAQNKGDQTKLAQNTGTAGARQQTSSNDVSFREYFEDHHKAYQKTARRIGDLQEFENKYLSTDE